MKRSVLPKSTSVFPWYLPAALYLLPLDVAFQESIAEGSILYRRFMDDFVILDPDITF